MAKNKLLLAAAGSGKTTYIIKEALKDGTKKILITTYTTANEAEIKKCIIDINKFIPENITIQTWFSFLLQHGVRPYQGGVYNKRISGIFLVNEMSAPYVPESDLETFYFTKDNRIYTDKLSKFVVKCNEKSNGNVIRRISDIYSDIYVDEVQDLAGYDLDILKLLFKSSSRITLVGDPRQVTYLTHFAKRFSQYSDGLIKDFVLKECADDDCEVDESTLSVSYRNNKEICAFSSKLYPNYQPSVSANISVGSHFGVFLVNEKDVEGYCNLFSPTILKYSKAIHPELNYGISKGLGFDRVLLYPTKPIVQYLKDGELTKNKNIKDKKTGLIKIEVKDAFDIAKFYVAITRARFSVAIVCEDKDYLSITNINKYDPSSLF